MPEPIPIPDWMRRQFEAGDVPCDEPPGVTERAYQQWKAQGGQVKAERLPGPPPPSLRDWFAGQALVGMLQALRDEGVRQLVLENAQDNGRTSKEQLAHVCFRYADEMLKAREGCTHA